MCQEARVVTSQLCEREPGGEVVWEAGRDSCAQRLGCNRDKGARGQGMRPAGGLSVFSLLVRGNNPAAGNLTVQDRGRFGTDGHPGGSEGNVT